MQTPTAESSVPAAAELNPMCQTKQEVDPTKDTERRGQPFTFHPLPSNASYHEAWRHLRDTVPITPSPALNHRATRNHRGHAVHFSMGVYENESPTKASHCYSPYGRMRPYFIPHRTRTKSESSDPTNHSGLAGQDSADNHPSASTSHAGIATTLMETCEHSTPMMDDVSINAVRYSRNPIVLLKKSRSLENVRVDNSLDGSQVSHEMEFVSSRIQKLKVQE
uniref:Uncharacterized protein n=1 Tax=Anopheles coluzzii TaxID=1518534 RepID=A0A8W7P0P4_ANOCL